MLKKHIECVVPKSTDSEEVWKNFITQLVDVELDAILCRVNSNPLLKSIKIPKQLEENLWKQINDYEDSKKSF